MKINFILPGVDISGGVRVIFEYANRLAERGHDVTILSPTIPSRMDDRWTSLRAKIRQIIGTLRRFSGDTDVSWFDLNAEIRQMPSLSSRLNSIVATSVPDADMTIATAWQTAYFVDSLPKSKGEKAYFVQHYEIWDTWNSDEAWEQVTSLADEAASYPIEMYEVTPLNPKVKRQKELVDHSYELPLSKITISSWLEKLLESKFNQDVTGVITNSVNHSIFYPERTDNSDTVSILLPSRDTPWKGEREAQELVKEIGTSYDVDIHMYGSEPEQCAYSDYVIQHSNISDEKLRHLYSNADIFVLPSWVEGFGLPPLEAMACKCAVVATNVGGVPDYAEHGETAIVVPPRDSLELIEGVRQLINDEEKRMYLQEQGYKQVQKYTWSDATEKLEQALQNITS